MLPGRIVAGAHDHRQRPVLLAGGSRVLQAVQVDHTRRHGQHSGQGDEDGPGDRGVPLSEPHVFLLAP
jgi:hypothetical protein